MVLFSLSSSRAAAGSTAVTTKNNAPTRTHHSKGHCNKKDQMSRRVSPFEEFTGYQFFTKRAATTKTTIHQQLTEDAHRDDHHTGSRRTTPSNATTRVFRPHRTSSSSTSGSSSARLQAGSRRSKTKPQALSKQKQPRAGEVVFSSSEEDDQRLFANEMENVAVNYFRRSSRRSSLHPPQPGGGGGGEPLMVGDKKKKHKQPMIPVRPKQKQNHRHPPLVDRPKQHDQQHPHDHPASRIPGFIHLEPQRLMGEDLLDDFDRQQRPWDDDDYDGMIGDDDVYFSDITLSYDDDDDDQRDDELREPTQQEDEEQQQHPDRFLFPPLSKHHSIHHDATWGITTATLEEEQIAHDQVGRQSSEPLDDHGRGLVRWPSDEEKSTASVVNHQPVAAKEPTKASTAQSFFPRLFEHIPGDSWSTHSGDPHPHPLFVTKKNHKTPSMMMASCNTSTTTKNTAPSIRTTMSTTDPKKNDKQRRPPRRGHRRLSPTAFRFVGDDMLLQNYINPAMAVQ